MLQPSTRPSLREPLWTLALLSFTSALILAHKDAMEGVADGLSLCKTVIVPSLFPFLVLSVLTIELGLAARLGRLLGPVMSPFFRVNGSCACALVLGLIGGYPVGARTAVHLYESGLCSKTEARRLLAFCNNSGPAFLFGVVGAGIFADRRVGLLLYATHVLAALCVGLLFRFYGRGTARAASASAPAIRAVRFSSAFTASVSSALQSILNVCSFVVLFSVILALLERFGLLSLLSAALSALGSPIGLTEPWAHRLLVGLLELSSGVSALSGAEPLCASLPLASFLLGWAGLSIHCQTLSFLGETDLGTGTYLTGKALHAVFSAALTALVLRLFPLSQTVSALNGTVTAAGAAVFPSGAWLLFLSMVLPFCKKEVEKARKTRYNKKNAQ